MVRKISRSKVPWTRSVGFNGLLDYRQVSPYRMGIVLSIIKGEVWADLKRSLSLNREPAVTMSPWMRPHPGTLLNRHRISKLRHWGGWTRTINFLINSQAVCQLTYAPSLVAENKTARLCIWRARVTC